MSSASLLETVSSGYSCLSSDEGLRDGFVNIYWSVKGGRSKGFGQVSVTSFSTRRTYPFISYETVYSKYAASNELASSGVKLNFALAVFLIVSQEHRTFVRIANPIPHGWQNAVETCSFQTALRYKIGRVYWASSLRRKVSGPYFQQRSKEKNGRFGAPTERERDHKVKVEMSEEIQRLKSELDGMVILLKRKEEQIRYSKRRSKLRIYHPDTTNHSSNETYDNRTNQWPSG